MKDRRETTYIVVHCADTPDDMDVGVEEITQWHKERGFRTVGYHYVIRLDGTIEQGREPSTIGAHVKGHNDESIGICVVGRGNLTPQQDENLFELIRLLKRTYTDAEIIGHTDLDDGKTCPNFDVKEWWEKKNE
tara:strand:- start:16807 stop:17208 length:402 start_codon:yes stop_codon:yes gene_type:complete